MNATQNVTRGKLGAAVRYHPEDTATADRLRAELKASQAEDKIRELADTAGLSIEQRVRLASELLAAAV